MEEFHLILKPQIDFFMWYIYHVESLGIHFSKAKYLNILPHLEAIGNAKNF